MKLNLFSPNLQEVLIGVKVGYV